MAKPHWFDRLTAPIAPRWTLRRMNARVAADLALRHYDGAALGRRTAGWRRSSTDANLAGGPNLARLREAARDLVRNNGYAEAALSTIVDQAVGWGISAKPSPKNDIALNIWKAWAESTDCDADGRHDFYGIQKLVLRTTAESGECLVRRRYRLPKDGLSIPVQLQVLEPDFLDTAKDEISLPNLGRIVQGVEFDAIGNRVAYWLFRDHPGSNAGSSSSYRVPAEGVLHVFRSVGLRPGTVRGPSWFAPVLLGFNDFADLADATLMKQKIAACLAVITTDLDGTATALGTANDTKTPGIDSIEPGMIMNMPSGRTVEVVQPPSVREYDPYSKTILRGIAKGMRLIYEDVTGDYSDFNFSSARMSRLTRWQSVDADRWQMLVPQFCDPAWKWAMTAAQIAGKISTNVPTAEWTAPPMPMIEPDKEGLAYQRNIRSGIMTLSEAVRERGYDPDQLFAEMAEDNRKLDALGLMLDSDARQMTQAGQLQGKALPATAAQPAASTNGNGSNGRGHDESMRAIDDVIARFNSRLRRYELDTQG